MKINSLVTTPGSNSLMPQKKVNLATEVNKEISKGKINLPSSVMPYIQTRFGLSYPIDITFATYGQKYHIPVSDTVVYKTPEFDISGDKIVNNSGKTLVVKVEGQLNLYNYTEESSVSMMVAINGVSSSSTRTFVRIGMPSSIIVPLITEVPPGGEIEIVASSENVGYIVSMQFGQLFVTTLEVKD